MTKVLTSYLLIFIILQSPQIASSQEELSEENVRPLIYFILDASRSMWGRIEDRPKIDIAKEVLISFLNKAPADTDFGVTVYGHRKPDDCSDIEEIITPAQIDLTTAEDRLRTISAVGKSPLADSIRSVIEKIKAHKGTKRIVLISDGIEACGKNPCELTRSLKQSGIDFTLDVIGFNVKTNEANQLECLAKAGGGIYRSAEKAKELLGGVTAATSIRTSTQETPLTSVIRSVPTPLPHQAKSGNGRIQIEHDAWLIKPHYWKLLDADTGDEVAKYDSFEVSGVPEGRFILAWRQYRHGSTEIILNNSLEVRGDRVTIVPLHTAIRLEVPLWCDTPRYWGLRDIESKEQIVTFGTFEPYLVPAGEYELIWRQYENRGETLSFGPVSIESGKTNYITLKSSLQINPSAWVPKEPYYWGLKNSENGEWVARYYGSFDQQLVPPGKYIVVYRQSETNSTDSDLGEVVITEDQNIFEISSGIRLLTKFPDKKPEIVEFAELGEGDKITRVVRLRDAMAPMALKPGKYKVTYVASSTSAQTGVTSPDEIEIKAGEFLELDLDDLFHAVSITTTPETTPFDEKDSVTLPQNKVIEASPTQTTDDIKIYNEVYPPQALP